jgi:uncharacterized membrane protein YdjX (TVP38/TMEM64 family)
MKLPKTPVLILMALLAMAAGFVAWKMGWVEWALAMKEPVLNWCRSNPVALFAAIAILPGFGFPASPLLILAGAVWGSNPWACAISLLALILNICWTHLLAAGPLRQRIIRLLGSRLQVWLDMPTNDLMRVSCLLRVTPGVPLLVQNYAIGILGIPLRYSVLLAIPITGLYVCGFVLTGGAIFEGRIGVLILGISILIAATLTIKIIRGRINPAVANN